jgi:hypothetical protein
MRVKVTLVCVQMTQIRFGITLLRVEVTLCMWKTHLCLSIIAIHVKITFCVCKLQYPCRNHTWVSKITLLRVEIILVRVEITLVRVESTFWRVFWKLNVSWHKYLKKSTLMCVNFTCKRVIFTHFHTFSHVFVSIWQLLLTGVRSILKSGNINTTSLSPNIWYNFNQKKT